MQVISFDMLTNQKNYDIAIYMPAFRQPILAKGRIVWQKPYNGKNKQEYYRIGFEFIFFKGNAVEQLEKLEADPRLREIKRD